MNDKSLKLYLGALIQCVWFAFKINKKEGDEMFQTFSAMRELFEAENDGFTIELHIVEKNQSETAKSIKLRHER